VAAGKVSHDDPPLAELLERWMEHIAELGRADTTLYHYRQYIDREIDPVLGAIRLSRLKALDIDRLYTKLRKRGLAPATIRQIHAILRASLNQAERWGLVQRNVAKLASAPSQPQPQREQHPPSVDEVVALMVAAKRVDPLFGLYIRGMVATGARRAEVGGLRWTDVDFDLGALTVERSYTLVLGTRRGLRPDPRSSRGGAGPVGWVRTGRPSRLVPSEALHGMLFETPWARVRLVVALHCPPGATAWPRSPAGRSAARRGAPAPPAMASTGVVVAEAAGPTCARRGPSSLRRRVAVRVDGRVGVHLEGRRTATTWGYVAVEFSELARSWSAR
jgi:integrase